MAKCPAGCISSSSFTLQQCAEAATNSDFKDEEAGFAVNHQVETFSPVAYAMGDYAFTDTISGN